jgi:hypothetical protein
VACCRHTILVHHSCRNFQILFTPPLPFYVQSRVLESSASENFLIDIFGPPPFCVQKEVPFKLAPTHLFSNGRSSLAESPAELWKQMPILILNFVTKSLMAKEDMHAFIHFPII